jgi:hypothetical protein
MRASPVKVSLVEHFFYVLRSIYSIFYIFPIPPPSVPTSNHTISGLSKRLLTRGTNGNKARMDCLRCCESVLLLLSAFIPIPQHQPHQPTSRAYPNLPPSLRVGVVFKHHFMCCCCEWGCLCVWEQHAKKRREKRPKLRITQKIRPENSNLVHFHHHYWVWTLPGSSLHVGAGRGRVRTVALRTGSRSWD